MAERYKRVFALQNDLYAEGSPIIIAAGALLKDTQTERVLAQLKLRSVSGQRITAVTVCLRPMDPARRPVGEPVSHTYFDLSASCGDEFGQKVPLAMPKAARSFTVEVTEVVFGNCSVWSGTEAPWTAVEKPRSLMEALQGLEMVEQYRIKYGRNSEVYPSCDRDLWYCACGRLNQGMGKHCLCGKYWDNLQKCDLAELRAEMELRLEQERQAEEEARLAAEKALAEAKAAREAKLEKIKGLLKKYRLAIILLAVAILIGVCLPLGLHIGKTVRYNKAEELLAQEQYEEAIERFGALKKFKDSAERKTEAEAAYAEALEQQRIEGVYAQANALFEEGRYREAMATFRTVHDYAESADMEERCAVELIKEQLDAATSYVAAVGHLKNLALYKTKEAKAYCTEGWYNLYTKAMEEENVANAEECLEHLSGRADLDELKEATQTLKEQLEAKAAAAAKASKGQSYGATGGKQSGVVYDAQGQAMPEKKNYSGMSYNDLIKTFWNIIN